MGDTRETACTSCGARAPTESMVEIDDDHHQCESCHERHLEDFLIPERAPVSDDTLTRPLGDPDEAAHRHGSAA
ncbi:hypothetical protein [Streptomyces hebeiensis]